MRLFMAHLISRQLLLFLACSSVCLGQTSSTAHWFTDLKGTNTGHTVANFLSLPISAGNLAIGELATSGMMDATDIPLRPANTGLFNFQKLAASHCEWLMDTRSEFAGACFPIIDVGTIGGYFRLFTPGSFSNARDIDQEPSHPSMLEYAVGASYGCSFFEKTLALGAAVSYVESRLDETAGRSAIATVDVAIRPSPLLSIHCGVANLGPPITYIAAKEPLPAQVDLSAEFRPLALKEEVSDIISMAIGCGVRKISDQAVTAGGGIQACLFRQFTLRTGYDYTSGSHPSIVGLSAGAGVDVGPYGADFGWKDVSLDLGSVWGVSVKMNLKEITPKTAEEYYIMAEKYYTKHNVRFCVYNAKKALKLNPNMWKAHALIAMANAEQRREKNLEVALIYTANTKGQFLPLSLAKGTLGGLARQATIIKQLSQKFPTHIIIDGGNIITETTHPLKAKLSRIFFDELGYDAASVGEQETRYGMTKLYPTISRMKTEFVFSNLITRFGLGNVLSKKTISKNGYQFFVLSMVAPGMLASPAEREKLFLPLDELQHNLAMSVAKNASVRILIVHDAWEKIASYGAMLLPNDIIIAASMKQEFSTPMKAGGAIVLSPGEYGKYVGNCILRFSEDKKLLSCENHLIPLTEDVPSDSSIEAKTRIIAGKVDLDSQGITEQELKRSATSGVFAFCSKRNDIKAIYLKVVSKNAEFPLTNSKYDCGAPVVSFAASRIVYFERNSDADATTCPVLSIMDLAGTGKRRIPIISCPRSAAFTPDGAWLYFAAKMNDSTSDIFRMKPDGTVISPVIAWKNSNEGSIAFSHDGTGMVFGSNANGKWQLFISDPDGQKPVCISDGSADFMSPKYSADGKHIALLSNKTSFGGTYDLWMYEFATSVMSPVSHDARVRDFCWLDNSTVLASCKGDTGVLTSFAIATKTGTPFIPSSAPKSYGESSPAVIPYGNTVKIIYTREYFNGSKRIFWVNRDGTGDECIVNSDSQDWLE
jgi:hypothetical protein